MKLRIQLPAGVMVINGDYQVSRRAILICSLFSDPGGGIQLQFVQSFGHRPLVSLDEARVTAQTGQHGSGFRSGEGEIVQMSALRLPRTICTDPVGAPALAQGLACFGIKPLAQCLKIIRFHLTADSEQLCALPTPTADDAFSFGVVVAVLEVPG
ncbi:MAG TPA: hypothetical protein VE398_22750 [Acidobacteriota bacterium]|nr:hypothetical protein [Acidobacteriota bacterium]